MEEIRRIPNPVSTPQPVGKSHRKQPGENRDEFREILEQERGESEEEEKREPGKQQQDTEDSANRRPGGSEPDRGRLLDERA